MTEGAENLPPSSASPDVKAGGELALLGPQLNRAFWAGLVGLAAVAVTVVATVALSRSRVTATGFGFVVSELGLLAVVLLRMRRRALHQAMQLAAQQRDLEVQSRELETRAKALELEAERSRFLADYLRDTNQELRASFDALSHSRAEADVAHRKREESDSALDVVLASAPFGIAVLDRELRIERSNPALTAFDGLPPADLVGRRARDVIPPAFVGAIEPVLKKVLESERPVLGVQVEGETAGSSGRSRQWMVNVYPVRGRDGAIRGVGLIVVDTTERRELERQLLHAQKMEAVGRLAGSIAHDFNNLLTAIAAFGQFALEGLSSDHTSRDDIGQIILATERGSALTRRLLAFSRQQVLQPRALDLNRLVLSLEGLMRRLLGEDVNLRTRLAPDLPRIDVDPGQTEQVILNLAINARDAMPRGGTVMIATDTVELDADYVRMHRDARTGPHVVLTISDTGVGMDLATQQHVFEPFFTTKPLGKGTGLGLSTVYGIVKQSGGSIWLYSERGRGTTFKIFFPQGVLSADAGAHSDEMPQKAGMGSLTVMLVEDDAAVRQAVHRVLVRNGCRVHEAEHGAQALELLETMGGAVDLVLSDLIMPELGGLEFSRRIREKWPKVRMLFMSGYAADSTQREALANSGCSFIEKPFTTESLIVKVREAVENRGAAGSAAA